MIEGWCIRERADVAIGNDRRCLTDGTPAIPPSWSDAGAVWMGNGWSIASERPEGYVYVTPAYLLAPKPKAVATQRTLAPKPTAARRVIESVSGVPVSIRADVGECDESAVLLPPVRPHARQPREGRAAAGRTSGHATSDCTATATTVPAMRRRVRPPPA